MAIYRYKQSPLIDRIEVHTPRPGMSQATVITTPNADVKALEQLRASLGASNLSTLMDTVEGRPAIQVRGFKNVVELHKALGKAGISNQDVEREATPDDHKKPPNFRERVRGKALFLSAIFYDLGNIAFFVSGIQRGRHNEGGKFTGKDFSEIGIGAAFSVGDILMTAYGHDRGDEELTIAAQGLKRHLHQKGIEIPQGDALNPDTLHESGAMKTTDRWLRKNVVKIKCLSEMAGGLFTMYAALKPMGYGYGMLAGKSYNSGKLAAGFIISTGWMSTFLLDKPRGHEILNNYDPDHATLYEKITHNPRGWIARPFGMANNVANLWGSLNTKNGERTVLHESVKSAQEWLDPINLAMNRMQPEEAERLVAFAKAKQHDYIWNVFSACSFLVAHTLFGISGSKRPHETEDDKAMMNDLVLLSANVLAQQPEEVRDASISETAAYVSKLAHVDATTQEVEAAIRDKVNALSQSTWAAQVKAGRSQNPQLSV